MLEHTAPELWLESIELQNLDCPDCAATIERDVRRLPGVLVATANFAAARLNLSLERNTANLSSICRAVESHGVGACVIDRLSIVPPPRAATGWKALISPRNYATFITAILTLTAMLLPVERHSFQVAICGVAITLGGYSTFRAAIAALKTRYADMNLLMTLAVVGACAIGDWVESASVVALFSIGNLLQAGALERTRRSIRALVDLQPRTARVIRSGIQTTISAEVVQPGDLLMVNPGECIPSDGMIEEGGSHINEAAITGESMPVYRTVGERVHAGSLNGAGALTIISDRAYPDSTIARIIHSVEEAQASRAPAQQIIDRFARVYTPTVVALALTVCVVPPILHMGTWAMWFERALSLLIISCPCALVISTPVAIVTAIGAAAKRGALIKGGAHLEALSRIKVLLFDKTGTLTTGKFQIQKTWTSGEMDEAEALQIAAILERRSEHPLSSAFPLRHQHDNANDFDRTANFVALPGLGATADLDGQSWLIGSLRLMNERHICMDAQTTEVQKMSSAGATIIAMARDNKLVALFAVADHLRDSARAMVSEIEHKGIKTSIVTGDSERVGQVIADHCGIETVHAGLLPSDKLALVKDYQMRDGDVGMVGDGINDAPALAAANVGLAIGAAGNDTAIETADIALLGGDLNLLPWLITHSHRTVATIRTNIGFSLFTKIALVVTAITVGVPMWLAVAGDTGVSLVVTMNSLRLKAKDISRGGAEIAEVKE